MRICAPAPPAPAIDFKFAFWLATTAGGAALLGGNASDGLQHGQLKLSNDSSGGRFVPAAADAGGVPTSTCETRARWQRGVTRTCACAHCQLLNSNEIQAAKTKTFI